MAFAKREGDKVEDNEWLLPKEKANKKKNEAKKTCTYCCIEFTLSSADLDGIFSLTNRI